VNSVKETSSQGSKSESVENEEAIQLYTQTVDASVKTYHDLMEFAPEMARSVLHLSLYTEFIETGSLAAYARCVNYDWIHLRRKKFKSMHNRYTI